MENFYDLIKYIFLGLFQGITEPIPVSSSGHLEIAEHFFKLKIEGLSFALLMNTASLFAVLLIYRADIIRLIVNGIAYLKSKDPEAKSDFMFIIYLIIGTIPAGVIGVLFGDFIEKELSHIKTVGVTLIVTGLALWLIRNMRGRKNDGDLSFKDAIIVGLAQAVALIPGISRSGATIVAAMSLGMKQETALRYSFLLYIPVSFGGMILGFSDLLLDERLGELAVPYIFAFIASLVASYFSLKWFMNIMARGNLKYFAIYCFIVGPLVLFFS
ncbi:MULTISPECIES: undecaprenyl-diphosphate phosphatase [Mesobacillus]|uniref:undecaprenyl-diphosphate phosphatase n=1 Tax=Mesobacillus TaxID=2675231 RepID=UPI00177FA36F|nr:MULTISPECIES: undecaprenyl-diphosphate phosphatase [Mesobacillus]MCM3573171.1 undecaprenyl-diphosphate phosphatase [Mesobacillus subterraneus]UYZ23202.1 undecaprenyl-diphosphate phosphatase [Mesobacillus jeotgali]